MISGPLSGLHGIYFGPQRSSWPWLNISRATRRCHICALSHVRCTVKTLPPDVSDKSGLNGAREMSDAVGTANSYSPPPQDRFAAELRGFGPLGILALLVIAAGQIVEPLSAVLVLVWTRLSHTPWREIDYARPKSWIGSLVVGIAFGIPFKFLMKAIVMPLLGGQSDQSGLPLPGRKPSWSPSSRVDHDCRRGLRGRDRIPRVHVRTIRQASRTEPSRPDRDRARIVRIVRVDPLLRSRAGWRPTGDHHWSGIRDGLCGHRADLDADVCACYLRSDCGRDHLLESSNLQSLTWSSNRDEQSRPPCRG